MVPGGRLISVADDLPLKSVPLSFGWVNESTPPRGRKAADGFGADKYSSRVFMDGGNAALVFSSREGAVRSSSCRLSLMMIPGWLVRGSVSSDVVVVIKVVVVWPLQPSRRE